MDDQDFENFYMVIGYIVAIIIILGEGKWLI
jgi:hypothetical protein